MMDRWGRERLIDKRQELGLQGGRVLRGLLRPEPCRRNDRVNDGQGKRSVLVSSLKEAGLSLAHHHPLKSLKTGHSTYLLSTLNTDGQEAEGSSVGY